MKNDVKMKKWKNAQNAFQRDINIGYVVVLLPFLSVG